MALDRTIRDNEWLYELYRRVRMIWVRARYGLRHVDPTFYMAGRSRIARDFRAGPHSFVNHGCVVGPGVEIGAYTMFGPRVAVVGDDHVFDDVGTPIVFAGRPEPSRTTIGRDVWVGYGAVIMAGTTIGDGAIVAARSVVTEDVPPFTIVGGTPARPIRDRFDSEEDRKRHEAMLNEPPARGARTTRKPGE